MRRSALVKVPSFSRNEAPGKEYVGVARGFVEEQILNDHAFHRLQTGGDVQRVGIGLRDILALDVEPLEVAVDRLIHHVGDAQPRSCVSGTPHSFSNISWVASSETWR